MVRIFHLDCEIINTGKITIFKLSDFNTKKRSLFQKLQFDKTFDPKPTESHCLNQTVLKPRNESNQQIPDHLKKSAPEPIYVQMHSN